MIYIHKHTHIWKSEIKIVELALSFHLYAGSGLNSGLYLNPLRHLVNLQTLKHTPHLDPKHAHLLCLLRRSSSLAYTRRLSVMGCSCWHGCFFSLMFWTQHSFPRNDTISKQTPSSITIFLPFFQVFRFQLDKAQKFQPALSPLSTRN